MRKITVYSREKVDNSEVSKRPPHKPIKYWAWAMGGPIFTILNNMWSRWQYYAAHILLFSQLTISLIYLIYSTVDAFNDPIVGILTDRSARFTERFGKRWPWIMIGRVFQPIFLILCFVPLTFLMKIPSNLIISVTWAILMMCIFETMGTLSEVNQSALFPDLFRGVEERSKSIRAQQVIGILFQVAMAIFIPLIIQWLGGEDSQQAFIGTAIICAVIVYILLIPFAYGAHENKEMRTFRMALDKKQKEKNETHLKTTLNHIFTDKNWMTYVIMFFLYSVAGICFLNGLPFFFYDGLGYDIGSIEAILPYIIVLLMTFVGSLLFIPLVKKYGAKKCTIVSLFSLSFFFLAMFFIPVSFLNYLCIFGGLSYGGVIVSGLYLNAEAIDNAVIKWRVREEGSYIGILRVFTAYSYALQTFIFAIVSSYTGFVSGDPSTFTELAFLGLLLQISIIPFIILIIGTIIFAFGYTIKKEDALRNSEELKRLGL